MIHNYKDDEEDEEEEGEENESKKKERKDQSDDGGSVIQDEKPHAHHKELDESKAHHNKPEEWND